jgi:hypothetical protein
LKSLIAVHACRSYSPPTSCSARAQIWSEFGANPVAHHIATRFPLTWGDLQEFRDELYFRLFMGAPIVVVALLFIIILMPHGVTPRE